LIKSLHELSGVLNATETLSLIDAVVQGAPKK